MKTLLSYEIKKILKRKSTWIAFAILAALQLFLAIAGSLGATYADDKFVETHMTRNQITRKNGLALSGRSIDDALLSDTYEAYKTIDGMEAGTWLLMEAYQKNVRPYEVINDVVSLHTAGLGLDDSSALTAHKLATLRELKRTQMYEYYKLSADEKDYWDARAKKLPDTLTYQYAQAYQMLTDMDGCYMSCMLLTFFISVCMSAIFMEEHSKKTDQLILCTKNGRSRLYFAKIAAGSIVAFCCTLLFTAIDLAGNFFSFGPEGFAASIQSTMLPWYPDRLSIGSLYVLFVCLLLLSSVLSAILAMVLSELMRNATGAMAYLLGLSFMARLVEIPSALPLLARLWHCLPINLLKYDSGFCDLRLFSLPGMKITLYQAAPVLYIIGAAALIFIGKRAFCRAQIGGR